MSKIETTDGSNITQKSSFYAAVVMSLNSVGTALKDANNPFFKSKYADFPEILRVAREAFSPNGIGITQDVASDELSVTVTTIFMYDTGEMMRLAPVRVPLKENSPQAAGSAITYARRYSLQTAAGIAADVDDDGNAATHSRQAAAPARPAIPAKPAIPDELAGDVKAFTNSFDACVDMQQLKTIWESAPSSIRTLVTDAKNAAKRRILESVA